MGEFVPRLTISEAEFARREALLDAPEAHARRIVRELPPGARVQPPPDKPEAEMTNYERGWAMAYAWQRHVDSERPKHTARWLLKGAIVFGLYFALTLGLYLALGPQKWMPVLGFMGAAVWRGWLKAKP